MKLPTFLTALGSCLVTFSHGAVVAFANQNISIPSNFEGIYVNLETGATSTAPATGYDINFFFGGLGISNDADDAAGAPSVQFLRVGVGNFDAAKNSAYNDTIDGSSASYSTGFGGSGSPNSHLGGGVNQFPEGSKGFLGFSLDIGGNTHYGFMEVTLTNNGSGIIHSWSYEDVPNTAIVVVPEPSISLLGVIGLAALFRRRR